MAKHKKLSRWKHLSLVGKNRSKRALEFCVVRTQESGALCCLVRDKQTGQMAGQWCHIPLATLAEWSKEAFLEMGGFVRTWDYSLVELNQAQLALKANIDAGATK